MNLSDSPSDPDESSADGPDRGEPLPASEPIPVRPSGDVPLHDSTWPRDDENQDCQSRLVAFPDAERQVSQTAAASPPPPPPAKPGPGLVESMFWTVSVIAIHVAAAISTMLILGMTLAARSGVDAANEFFQNPSSIQTTGVLVGEMSLFVLAVLVASYLRLQPGQFLRRLGFAPLAPVHFLCLLFLLIPLSIVSGEIYRVFEVHVWQPLTEASPQLKQLDNYNSVKAVQELSNQVGFSLMILLIAVAPAIGEELVFRGVIGRGLVARLGPAQGVLVTSALFAAVHLHPVHAVGVFLLGAVMHYLHLVTRSFVAPVMLHFANNSWATFWTKFGGGDVLGSDSSSGVPPMAMLLSLTLMGSVTMLLWQTRVRYVLASGESWDPGYFTVERPLIAGVTRCRGQASWWAIGMTGLLAGLFLLLYALEMTSN